MKPQLSLLLLSLLYLQGAHSAEIDDQRITADCAKVSRYGQTGDAAYQQRNYVKAYNLYQQQAAWSQFCQLPTSTQATAFNNVALTYLRRDEPLKAKAWLSIFPEDKKSIYNLSLVEPALVQLPTATSPEGEYWQYAGYGEWNTLKVTRKGQQFTIDYSGLYMGVMSMYGGPNMGEFSVVSPISDHHALYQIDEGEGINCKVDIAFQTDSVTLHTEGDCGFGHNVQAEGSYMRVSL